MQYLMLIYHSEADWAKIAAQGPVPLRDGSGVDVSNNSRTWAFVGLAR